MKTLHFNYSLTKRQRIKQLLLSVCFTLTGITAGYFLYVKNESNLLKSIVFIYTFFCLILITGQLLLGYKKYISLNVCRIEEKLSYWSFPQKINWNEIKKITLGLTSILIELNSGRTKQINLSTSSYMDIKSIKHYFFAFCLDKKIPCYVKSKKKIKKKVG